MGNFRVSDQIQIRCWRCIFGGGFPSMWPKGWAGRFLGWGSNRGDRMGSMESGHDNKPDKSESQNEKKHECFGPCCAVFENVGRKNRDHGKLKKYNQNQNQIKNKNQNRDLNRDQRKIGGSGGRSSYSWSGLRGPATLSFCYSHLCLETQHNGFRPTHLGVIEPDISGGHGALLEGHWDRGEECPTSAAGGTAGIAIQGFFLTPPGSSFKGGYQQRSQKGRWAPPKETSPGRVFFCGRYKLK